MNINVLNEKFNKIAVIDNYTSLMWCTRYYEVGAIDLEIEATVETINIFKKNNYITRDDDNSIYRIEAIEINTDDNGNDILIVGAYDMLTMLNQRITWETVISSNATIEEFIRDMITNNIIIPKIGERKIDNFYLDIKNFTTDRRTRQSSYDLIGDKVIELCVDNKLGCRINFDKDTKKFTFELYEGVDRTKHQNKNIPIIFSPDRENIFSTKYSVDISEEKNVALIGGEGQDKSRIITSFGDIAGLERREMFVDSSTKDEVGNLDEYYKTLQAEASAKISETKRNENFDCEIDTKGYKYKTDYNLGDIITIENQFKISSNARIVEIIETWNNEGYSIDPKFEIIEESIDFTNKLLTENSDVLLTEINEPLMYELSPLIIESGTSYIISEDDKLITVEEEK